MRFDSCCRCKHSFQNKKHEGELHTLIQEGDVPVTTIEGKTLYGVERIVVSEQTVINSQSEEG